jgi:hypothetical protein
MSSRKVERGKALTWRVLLLYLFVVCVLHPILIYNWLVNGLWGLAGLNTWIFILIAGWLASRAGSPLTKGEIFALRMVDSAGLMYTGYYFAYLLRNMYFANSEYTKLFGVLGEIPAFFAPLGRDFIRVSLSRTFLDPAWLQPVLVTIIVPFVLSTVANYVLGLISYSIFVREERLEFPLAAWDARLMLALGEREPVKVRVISLAILIGAMYGFATNGLALLFGCQLIPRTMVDFTGLIENVLPGAIFAFTTDLSAYISGLILPLRYTTIQLAASAVIFVFGNYYVTVNNLWPAEAKWQPSRGFWWNFNASTLYFWNSFAIGWGLAAALLPVVFRSKAYARALAGIARGFSGETEVRWLNPRFLLAIYLAVAAISVSFVEALAPGFPVHVLLLFTLGVSLLITLLQTHAAGILTLTSVPYMKEMLIYFSGYNGLCIWLLPAESMLFTGGSSVAQQLLQASMLGISVREYVRIYFLLSAIGLIGSFFFTSLFWSLFPIPSYAYPYTLSGWPVEAMNFWRWRQWLWKGYLFRPHWIAVGFGLSALLYVISEFALHNPSFPVAVMSGMLVPIHAALASFFGSLLSKLVVAFAGEKWWNENKGYVALGFGLGDGIVSAFLILLQLLGRSIWLLPY